MRRCVALALAVSCSVFSVQCGEGTEAAPDHDLVDPTHSDDAPASSGDAGTRPHSFDDAASAPDARATALTDARATALTDASGSPVRDAEVDADRPRRQDAGDAREDGGGVGDAGAPGDAACPRAGHITYTLERASAPSSAQLDAYAKIDRAMMRAVGIYNCQTDISKALRVQYDPKVQTADGNPNGTIRFGATSTFEHTRAMHEIAHTVGIGTNGRWPSMIREGLFTGERATAQLRTLTGKADDVVHADSQHFWPYGLNYASEVKSDADLVGHCLMVTALRKDLGL